MKAPNYQTLARLIGTLSVVASLLFVGFELKQSRDIAIADVYQQRTAMGQAIEFSRYSPEQYEIALKRRAVSEMTDFDMEVLAAYLSALFSYYENMHFQYELGMIPKDEWAATEKNIAGEFLVPCRIIYWENNKDYWRAAFASDVDKLILGMNIPRCNITQLEGLRE